MIGYYMKDKVRPRYRQYHTANITFEDMQVARMHTDNMVLVDGNLADHGLFPFFCVGLFPFILTVDGLMFFCFCFSHDYDSDCSPEELHSNL